MASETDELLAGLRARIDETRSEIAALASRLEAQVRDYLSPTPDLSEQLLSTAEEFGAAEAFVRMRARPSEFGVAGPIQLASDDEAAMERSIEKIVDAGDRLDQLAAERDAALGAREPSRQRAYHAHGREFTIDWVDKKVRYLDRAREAERLAIRAVEPRSGPKRPNGAGDRAGTRAQPQHNPDRPRGPTRTR